MSQLRYDLRTEPFIPGIDINGQSVCYGLRDLLAHAHMLLTINVSTPTIRASLHRIFEAILQRVFPVETARDWQALWNNGNGSFNTDNLDKYFNNPSISCRFDLFGVEQPFYQTPDSRVKPKSLLKLVPHLSSGNNATLFDHSLEKNGLTLSPAEAALYLIGIQNFGLGGLSGIDEKFTAAPPSRGISFVITGENLFQTLLLNHIPLNEPGLHTIPLRTPEYDLPVWEMDDPFTPRTTPYGLCDYLTWPNRRVLLIPDEVDGHVVVSSMTEAPGLRLAENYVDGVSIRDPYQFYRQSNENYPTVLRFSEGRAVWRDSTALFRFEENSGMKAPANMLWLKRLTSQQYRIIPKEAALRVSALGFAADKAKVLFYGNESIPVPSDFLTDPQLVQHLELALQKAETLSKALYTGTLAMAESIFLFDVDRPGSDGKLKKAKKEDLQPLQEHLRADRIYWSGLESGFHKLIETLPISGEDSLNDWDGLLRDQAKAALDYSISLAGDDVRARKGAVKAGAIVGKAINDLVHFGEEL